MLGLGAKKRYTSGSFSAEDVFYDVAGERGVCLIKTKNKHIPLWLAHFTIPTIHSVVCSINHEYATQW